MKYAWARRDSKLSYSEEEAERIDFERARKRAEEFRGQGGGDGNPFWETQEEEADREGRRVLRALAGDDAGELVRALQTNPKHCLLYTSPSPRDRTRSRMPSSA